MALIFRAALVSMQAIFNQAACTPPNKTQAKDRYHTEEPHVLQMAPLVFKIHTCLLWLCAAMEVISAIDYYFPSSLSPYFQSSICPASRPSNITPVAAFGVLLVGAGAFIRTHCFKELGQLFTFDLTIQPEHKLVTSGFYRYVRHPSYTGSLMLIAGISLTQLSSGGWVRQCGIIGPVTSALLWVVWWAWSMSVGISRAIAEDSELKKQFEASWDAYAADVPAWFVPGLF
ncbi:hypothetical protein BJ138DRAFT_1015414 [Hygrophoropsis aurantiaca]|uniref:Uncharacterized protein n=1 Tax=Hygrophoropsis aurantiaca TaxID=72124 RepID=A0ACB8A1A4_9AGAM|nr:hypothetical protein BJ138DRAFT_1015414 [Hygrophoropsis aurantiaca]